MLERAEELKQRVRETPLSERLTDARRRIGKMCSEGRPPHMTIPVQYDDDDFYISTTLSDAQATIADIQGQVEAWHKRVQEADEAYYAVGELNDALQQRVAQLEAWRDTVTLALQRPGGARFEDVPQHVRELVADHARVLGLVRTYVDANETQLNVAYYNLYQYIQAAMPAQPVCTNHFSDGSKIFPSRECACVPAQPAQGGE